ncbi:MAG: helix-turn-helix domain-containing protein [Ruminococcus sp.]|nr:helix-turn-helix domain-containing protein [Ruminococcus sp.]
MIYNAEEIGKRIREERLKLGLTQSELGEILFVKGKQISNYENGRLFVPVEMLVNMCKLFDCEMGYLLCEPEYSDGTRLETKIIESTGLTEESLENIRRITGDSKDCLSFGYQSDDYKRVINRLLSSASLISIAEGLRELDTCYALLVDESREEIINQALEIYTSTKDFEQLTDEESAFYRMADKLISKNEILEYSTKVCRYELWEDFNRLLDEMYPKKCN